MEAVASLAFNYLINYIGSIVCSINCLHMIPFINWSVDFLLSDQIEACDVKVREVIDEIRGQFEDYMFIFEAVVVISGGHYRVTCKSSGEACKKRLALL